MVTPQRRPKQAITPPTLAAPIAATAPMQAAQTGAAIGCAAHAVVQVPRIMQQPHRPLKQQSDKWLPLPIPEFAEDWRTHLTFF